MKLLSICNKLYSKLTGKDEIVTCRIRHEELYRIVQEQETQIGLLNNKLHVQNKNMNNRTVDNRVLQDRITDLQAQRVLMQKELNELRNKPDVVVTERTFVMTTEMYDKFAKSLEPPVVTNNTTAQGAGYLVGMQRVLEKLRSEYVA